jgi:hypothetical protein
MSIIVSNDPKEMEKKGMVRMYQDEALQYASKLIKDWEPK